MDKISKQPADVPNEITQILAMNPNLTLDELNIVAQQKVTEQNNRPQDDFCGLSPTQMYDWLYTPFSDLMGVSICTPDNLSSSPVMSYLSLILDEAMQQGGSFKATAKGNLPVKLVKQASELLPTFAVAEFGTDLTINDFAGSKEDRFIALHYARILSEMAGIIYLRNGRFHVKKTAQKQYQNQGISAFFLPMLKVAATEYNWGYFDGWEHEVDLSTFWVFMTWRLHTHASIDTLIDEVSTAFPDVLSQLSENEYFSQEHQLRNLLESRYVERFLQFWGFVTLDPRKFIDQKSVIREVSIQPLMKETFTFTV